ncbi:MAG: hypothetical protein JWM91_4107 [Rhodospirillales bacterium]|nr:hypothetical protein [Rhodospirillales bacterium]
MAYVKKALASVALALTVCSTALLAADEKPAGSDAVTRRLSQEQYRQVVSDLFGPSIKVGGRFEPDIRRDGLLAMGASQVSVTASGLEEYDKIARNVAAQVVSEQHRDTLIPCKPANAKAPDDACAAQFLSETGPMLYRRPLMPEELQSRVKVAADAATGLKDFYSGLGISLATMLESPKFLFRQEIAESDPNHAGQYRMDAYSKASQLSFFLWNAAPDPELLAAAEHGDLNSDKGLAKQVDRMIASPRLQGGVRAFFTDMLGFDEFETLAKDSMIFPKFNTKVAKDAQEQTLRTVTNLLVTQKADYRDIFTTHKTYLSPLLASVYEVPLVAPAGGWATYEFPEGDPRAGIVSQVSFVALHSHPGRSSPTLRGKAVREVLLCQKVPTPPANVNFTLVQDTKNPQYKTARARLHAHATDATCAGCHKIMDPIGLGLEAFDSGGSLRASENGETIDTTGELDGMKFTDAGGLAKAVHDDPAAPACVVSRASSYGLGRLPAKDEAEWVKNLQAGFKEGGYRFPALLRLIATSPEFYRVAPPQMGAIDGQSKLAQTNSNQEIRK